MKKWPVYLLVALAPLCWAGDIVIARGISNAITPFSLVFWRWFLAFLFLLPFSWKLAKADYPVVKESWGTMCLLSVLGISGFISLLYFGVHSTTAINSALIQTLLPGIIVLLCLIIYKEKTSRQQLFGLAICFVGAAYVVTQGNLVDAKKLTFVSGDLLLLIATVLYGLYSSLLPKSPKMHPLSFLFYLSAIGVVTLFPFYLFELFTIGPFQLNKVVIGSILYVAIFPSIVAYICWNKGIELLGPTTTGLFINLIPIFAAILAVPFLKETFAMFHLVGMILIFTGIIVFNRVKTTGIVSSRTIEVSPTRHATIEASTTRHGTKVGAELGLKK